MLLGAGARLHGLGTCLVGEGEGGTGLSGWWPRLGVEAGAGAG